MRLFKAFYTSHKYTIITIYILALSILYFTVHLPKDSNEMLGIVNLTVNDILVIFGAAAGAILGVIEPYFMVIFTPKGEWYRTIGIKPIEVIEYQFIYATVYSAIPTIITMLKGISITTTIRYVTLPSILMTAVFLTLKWVLAIISKYLHMDQGVTNVIYMVLVITFAANLSLIFAKHITVISIIALLIYMIGNILIFREVVS